VAAGVFQPFASNEGQVIVPIPSVSRYFFNIVPIGAGKFPHFQSNILASLFPLYFGFYEASSLEVATSTSLFEMTSKHDNPKA
jgi:hypothetical protein